MIPIYPIDEETCRQFYGSLVCAITNDGNRHIGILSRFSKNRLILNESELEGLGTQGARTKGKQSAGKAKVRRKAGPAPESITEQPAGLEAGDPFAFPQIPAPPAAIFGEPVSVPVGDIAMLFQVFL